MRKRTDVCQESPRVSAEQSSGVQVRVLELVWVLEQEAQERQVLLRLFVVHALQEAREQDGNSYANSLER